MLSPKLRLLSSSAYYLCDMPGNANVLANSINYDELKIETEELDALLLWILKNDLSIESLSLWILKNNSFIESKIYDNSYTYFITNTPLLFKAFYREGSSKELLQLIDDLRKKVYADGTDEQLLIGDIIAAITRKKIENASIYILSGYTDIDLSNWKSALTKETFIREFWPAQHLLGKTGVLRGQSAIVQMPTSAGKTKSTELILRSAFLSNRTNLAIIIAPFRALCHEITDSLKEAFKDESIGVDILSDVLQSDFDFNDLLGLTTKPQVLIVTPEKLLYVLRHNPTMTEYLKLIIFDEGHQFDTGKRGITYELLLTSLKKFIPLNAQKILFSAVISNAKGLSEWLNGHSTVVEGNTLIPTIKSIGFVSWRDTLGQIKYTNEGEDTFFVPYVIKESSLPFRKRRQKVIKFPEKGDGQDIALFLG